jgi:hypothetical protein
MLYRDILGLHGSEGFKNIVFLSDFWNTEEINEFLSFVFDLSVRANFFIGLQ